MRDILVASQTEADRILRAVFQSTDLCHYCEHVFNEDELKIIYGKFPYPTRKVEIRQRY